ncbi:hypothetical protein [Streptomyces sp. NPDC048361]|uniref:hypothetical protein n=1 Tax=Streptomyces sp. NPDC048361 TaxID=3154720 RepID=UPI003427B299
MDLLDEATAAGAADGPTARAGAGRRPPGPVGVEGVGAALAAAAREADDLLLVYYAGHSLLDHRGRLHLALTNTDPTPETLGFSAVPLELVLGLLAQARALRGTHSLVF